MRQFMSNDEKRAWRAAEQTRDMTPDDRWFMATVVHNNHLDETFGIGMIVYVRQDGEGWLVVRVTADLERMTKIGPMTDPTHAIVRLNSDTKAKWSLKATRQYNGELWHLDRSAAQAVESLVEAWKTGTLASK